MFDNPEKLFILLVIALIIFGPQKILGLGPALGRAVRDFRSAVRDAQQTFSGIEEVDKSQDTYQAPEPQALPAPDPIVSSPAYTDAQTSGAASAGLAPAADGGTSAQASDHEGPHSLASEPSAQAVRELIQRKE
jgi:TatA/E family protein of Tat protein translocase